MFNAYKYKKNSLTTIILFFLSLIVVSPNIISFFLPISLEGHETSAWLHVLTLDERINIYDHSKVAFVNQAHGPTTSYFYYIVYKVLPFLKSYQLVRLPVLFFPFIIFFIFYHFSKKYFTKELSTPIILSIFIYGTYFILFQNLGGRADYLASVFFCLSLFPLLKENKNFNDIILLSILIIFIFTSNWRFLPLSLLVFLHFIFQEYNYSKKILSTKNTFFVIATFTLAIIYFGNLIYFSFDNDLQKFFNHFFGIISKQDNNSLDRALNFNSILYSQWFNMIIKSEKVIIVLCFSVLLVINDIVKFKKEKSFFSIYNIIAITLIVLMVLISHLLNLYAGGIWYYSQIPLIFMVIFLNKIIFFYKKPSISKFNLIEKIMLILLIFLVLNSIKNTSRMSLRFITHYSEISKFNKLIKKISLNNQIHSDSYHFHKNKYNNETIDTAGFSQQIALNGRFGNKFSNTFFKNENLLKKDPPKYLIITFTCTSFIKNFAKKKYKLIYKFYSRQHITNSYPAVYILKNHQN